MFLKKNKKTVEESNAEKLSEYITSTLINGFSEEEIKNALLSQDWSEEMIDEEMSKVRDALSNQDKNEKTIEEKKPVFSFKTTIKKLINVKNKIKEVSIMPKKITAEQARSFLRQLEPEKSFWVNNGSVLGNLEELSGELKSMEPEKFSHHVTKGKNDFSAWVHEVIGDESLARNLSRAKTPKTLAKTVDKRMTYLKKFVE